MAHFNVNIKKIGGENDHFRRVLVSGLHSQIVVMHIPAGGDIGEEVHTVDQILFFISGEGKAVLDGEESRIEEDSLVFVPAGTLHNFINTGSSPLKLFTVYSPPEHADGTIHHTKAEAEAAEGGE